MPFPAAALVVAPAMVQSLPTSVVTATFTADNHYAIYTQTGPEITLIGGNEIGAAGSPGTFNWSNPETFTFTMGEALLIAVWSDTGSTQGLLGQVDLGSTIVRTGDSGWAVYQTDAPMGDGSAWPAVSQIGAWEVAADGADDWGVPYVGPKNTGSVNPWGKINGIGTQSHWTWAPDAGGGNPLTTAGDGARAVLFRYGTPSAPAPTPGGAGVLLGGSVAAAGWRRRR